MSYDKHISENICWIGADGRWKIETRSETLDLSVPTITTTNLIEGDVTPVFLFGVTCRVTETITGATTFDVGDGSDVDRWGAAILLTEGTTVDASDWTANTPGMETTALEVTLTANGSAFTDGTVEVVAYFLTLVP